MGHDIKSTRGKPLNDRDLANLRAAVDAYGVSMVASVLRLSTSAVVRAYGGLPVLRGTRSVVKHDLLVVLPNNIFPFRNIGE